MSTGALCTQIAMHAFVGSGHLVVCAKHAQAGLTEAACAAAGITFAGRQVNHTGF